MPWEEVSIMHQWKEFVSLALSEGANVSELCRRFGISRQTGDKWLRRAFVEDEDFADRPRQPVTRANEPKQKTRGQAYSRISMLLSEQHLAR